MRWHGDQPGVNAIKLFSFVADDKECLYLAITFHLLVTPGACPRRKHLKGPPIGFALALLTNSKTWLERVSKDRPSNLLGLIVSDKGK
jgi:hypothetical protein